MLFNYSLGLEERFIDTITLGLYNGETLASVLKERKMKLFEKLDDHEIHL